MAESPKIVAYRIVQNAKQYVVLQFDGKDLASAKAAFTILEAAGERILFEA